MSLPTPPWSELGRLLTGDLATEVGPRSSYGRDMWPMQIARQRRGEAFALPDAVAAPASVDDVSALLAWCGAHDVCVMPAGGRSGVCGGVLVDPVALGGRALLALNLLSLSGVHVDAADLRATALAGTRGPDYEQALQAHGLTGGHYPQSLAISTVGGWLACRSAGQFSTRFGRAEDLVAGLDVVLASGEIVRLGPHAATAAGPDLARVFLGSEGTLGVIVGATLRAVPAGPRPRTALRFERFGDGMDTVRRVVQAGVRPGVVRLYDEADTAWSFPDVGGSVLVLVFDGPLAGEEMAFVVAEAAAADGTELGPGPADEWLEHRFDAVEQLERVMRPDGPLGPNVIVDTMEVASEWSRVMELHAQVTAAVAPYCLGVLCHMSHVYPDGACLYFTLAMQGADEAEAEERYSAVWEAGMEATLRTGATITHHHGVGRLKAGWFRRELGEGGWALLGSLKRALDPAGILNPGNLGL